MDHSQAPKPSLQPAPAERDGKHDFDFEEGSWKIYLKRLLHPLTANTWVEFDGDSVTQKVWKGRAWIEQFETDSPVAGHIEGLTLRLYNPQSHQWSLYWATSKTGAMVYPKSASSRTAAVSFTLRTHSMAEPSLFGLFGRTRLPISLTSNSHSRTTVARSGK